MPLSSSPVEFRAEHPPATVVAGEGEGESGEEDEEDGEEDDNEDNEALLRVNQRAVLHVIEIHSGNILQTAPLELSGRSISSIIVDGDEI